MFPLPNPLSSFLLTSLLTSNLLQTPHATTPPNNPNHPPLLLLPTNDTTPPAPNRNPLDTTWYPYASTPSLPTSPTSLPPPPPPSSPNTTTPPPTAPKLVCNGARYGRNLPLASCLTAHARMDNSPLPKTYGERAPEPPGAQPPWDANLPLRILSSDAYCALDVSHGAAASFDTIAPTVLKSYARTLIEVCAAGTPSTGGVLGGLGEGGNLALRLVPYRPRVQCFEAGTGPPWETCRDVIDTMPVGGERERFGPAGDVLSGVVVPWVKTTEARRCAVTIDTTSTPDVCDFYKLWAAANAVDTLCVMNGKAGMAVGNGMYGNLVVVLKDLLVEPGVLNGSTGGVEELDRTS